MPMFARKPALVEAVRFTRDNRDEVLSWMSRDFIVGPECFNELYIRTMHGTVQVMPGDFIVKGAWGEFYPCRGDIFLDKYEATDPTSTEDDS